MAAKKTGSGMAARVAAHSGMGAVDAGLAAATGMEQPEAPAVVEAPAKAEVVALNIRLPKAMHRELRDVAHRDETSITAILIQAAAEWLARSKAE